MKRFFCFLFVLVLLPLVSFADLPDLSSLSRDELIELSHRIQSILFDSSLVDGVLIPAGEYIVGVDLPAGVYRADVVSDVGGVCAVCPSASETRRTQEYYLGNMYGTLTFRLTLEEGNLLTIKYNSLRLYPYSGMMDFSSPNK